MCNCLLVDIGIPVVQKQKQKKCKSESMAVNQGRWKETRFTDDETTDSVVPTG
jgi:hypothetical protein